MGYWSRFTRTADPNGSGAVSWPLYDLATDPYLELAVPATPGAGVRTDKCDFWDSLVAAPP
jgi:carboxylesterase type B